MPTLRPAAAQDYDAVAELYRQFAPRRRLGREQYDRWLGSCTLAADDGAVIGFCHGNHSSTTWESFVVEPEPALEWTCSYLDTLVVDAAHRRRGTGTRLLRAFMAQAASAGSTWVVLNPAPRTRDRAGEQLLAFYGAAGFVPLEPAITVGLTDRFMLGAPLVQDPPHRIRPLTVSAAAVGRR